MSLELDLIETRRKRREEVIEHKLTRLVCAVGLFVIAGILYFN